MLGLVALVVLLSVVSPANAQTNTWSGTWSTSWTGAGGDSAIMVFEQAPDNIVSGDPNGSVSASAPSFVSDGFFAGLQSPDTRFGEWADDSGNGGTFTLMLSADGQSWRGTYSEDGGGTWSATCTAGACLDNIVQTEDSPAAVSGSCGPTGPSGPVTVVDTNRTYTLLTGGMLTDDDFRVFEIDWGDGTTATLDNRATDEDGIRIASTAFHGYDTDGAYEVTVALVEGNSSITGPCEPGSASWTVQIDSSGVSEVAVASVIGSGVPVEDARFEGEYSMSAVISGVQYPESVYPPGYGVEAIGTVEEAAAPGVGVLWLESTLAATFAIGIHSALFRMIPITFMAGHKIWTVSRARWAAIYAPVVFLFVRISRQRSGDSSTVDWTTTLSLFVLFGLASVLFWAYWRNHDRKLESAEMDNA